MKSKHFSLRKNWGILLFSLFAVLITNSFAQDVPELLYYQFDEAGATVTNAASAPVGNNPATINNLTQGGAGQFGGGLIGTGGSSTADYVDTGWPVDLPGTGFTISFYVDNLPNNTDLSYMFGDNTATSFRSFIGGVAGAGNIILRGGGLSDCIVPGIAGGPNVIHFVYDGTNILGYKNGVLEVTVPDADVDVTGTTGPFKIGGYSSSTGMPAGGIIDEFRIYNRALDATEIAATWDQSLPLGPADVPMSSWGIVLLGLLLVSSVLFTFRRRII